MYEGLVDFYDTFMSDVDYSAWCDFAIEFIDGKTGVDVGCGSGMFTLELVRRGFDVTGVDTSGKMIETAYRNARKAGFLINFALMSAERLQLNKKVDFITAVCDVVNYLKSPSNFFKCAYDNLKDNGVLFFDVSSAYKLRNILGNNTFSDENNEVLYVWNNFLSSKHIDLELSFFKKENDGRYKRFDEKQRQYIHESSEISRLLSETGFVDVRVYSDFEMHKEKPNSERLYFVARKGIINGKNN